MGDKKLVVNDKGEVVVKEEPKSAGEVLMEEAEGFASALGEFFGLK